MSDKALKCEHCNGCQLALLLLRPSPIAKDGPLVPIGAKAVASHAAYMTGLLPARQPTESRFALRLLRPGYVHVYVPKPPKGMSHWLIYRVTEQGDMIPELHRAFRNSDTNFKCTEDGHNVVGMKVLRIPQAHKIADIWVAYSANLWDEKLRTRHAANPKVMKQVILAGGSPNTFKPMAERLQALVLECALPQMRVNEATDHDFPFCSLFGQADSLAKQMARFAAGHPQTKGRELAVVLDDPVGIAAELNALRLRRHELMEQYMLKPAVQHPLEVNKAIQIFKGQVMADVDERSMEAISPVMHHGRFTDTMRVKPNPYGWPEGTRWDPLPASRENTAKHGYGAGVVTFPDHEQRARQWAKRQADATWSRMLKFYDEGQRREWQKKFQQDMETLHLTELKRYEDDWNGALTSAALANYFALHFDDKASNSWKEVQKTGCCPGSVYCKEAWLAYTPDAVTGAARKTLEAQLDGDPNKAESVMLRAILANQMSLWEQLTTDSGVGDGKRDKTYDFIKGLISEANGLEKLPPALAKKFAWLTDVTLGFSAGIVGTLAAAAASSAAHAMANGGTKLDPKTMARLGRAQRLALIHRASEEALGAATGGRPAKVPVLLMADLDAVTALWVLQQRGETPKKGIVNKIKRSGRVQLGILTDTEELARLTAQSPPPLDAVKALAMQDGSVVKMHRSAFALEDKMAAAAVGGKALLLPAERFVELYTQHRAAAMRAPSALTQWLQKLAASNGVQGSGQHLKAAGSSLDWRLAIGSMIVQGLGLVNGLANYWDGKLDGDEGKQIDAMYGIADSVAGFLGGFAELGAAGLEVRLMLKAGESAVERSVGVMVLRGIGYGAGFAGNIVNAYANFRSAKLQEEKGNLELAEVLARGGRLFVYGSFPLAILALHSFAEAAVRRNIIRGVGAQVVRQIGKALGVRLLLSVPGWGWLITAVAVGHTVYVALETPTPLQQWLKGCYFGKPDKGVAKRKSWQEEQAALKQIEIDAKKELAAEGAANG